MQSNINHDNLFRLLVVYFDIVIPIIMVCGEENKFTFFVLGGNKWLQRNVLNGMILTALAFI